MPLSVSQLPALGIFVDKLFGLPEEIGVEVLYGCGDDFFWRHNIPRLMDGRRGPLSVHGPFSRIDLADREADWPDILEEYKRCFDFCARYHAVHCVCHPDGGGSCSDREEALHTAIERVLVLREEAERAGVDLLVENLPSAFSLFTLEVFRDILLPIPSLNFLLDTGHGLLSGWDLPRYMAMMGKRLHAIHIHEPKDGRDAHLPVGSGEADWSAFFEAYHRYTPAARLVCEYEQASLREILDSLSVIQGFGVTL